MATGCTVNLNQGTAKILTAIESAVMVCHSYWQTGLFYMIYREKMSTAC